MAFLDQVINFGQGTISGLGGLTAGQTSITLATGEGANFPSFPGNPYNIAITNATDFPDPSDYPNREIMRVTARSGDVLTVTRGQEGTVAFAHPSGKVLKIRLTVTKKFIDDLESRVGASFRATRGGTNQTSIAANTDTKVQFNTEEHDKSAEYDPATNFRFTAAVARRLVVRAQIRFLSISALGKSIQCRIYKNGSLYSIGEIFSVAAGHFIVGHSDCLELAATDYVEIFARHDDVAARDIDGGATVSFFTGS